MEEKEEYVYGAVYFIKSETFIKVGMVKKFDTVGKRISSMQTGNPNPLELLGVIKTWRPDLLESDIHDILRPIHIRGEWFKYDSEKFNDFFKVFPSCPMEIVHSWASFVPNKLLIDSAEPPEKYWIVKRYRKKEGEITCVRYDEHGIMMRPVEGFSFEDGRALAWRRRSRKVIKELASKIVS